VDNLCSDLLNWRTLYLAGRMHKPLRIIKDDARVRLTQQVNLTSAVRAALLTLPEEFTENELFERIAGISYSGDPRMLLPAENRGKVGNIVRKQSPQFKELYHRLIVGLPGVHWPLDSSAIQQDISARARSAHLRKLPSNLLTRVKNTYSSTGTNPELEADEAAYWMTLAGDAKLPQVLTQGNIFRCFVTQMKVLTIHDYFAEMSGIVRYPATVQSLKGLASVGVTKSLRYSTAKIGKWWSGS
jgi:translocator assembly and maintenance protein 41